ncbi:MAG: hypothetical protein COB22_06685 [Cycloclasticus sp.]|nr:MAG: hypothetical protein COB22_06685 [Cycloclasticus sp.]
MPKASPLKNNTAVRDLDWVLNSPPLLQGNKNHCNWTNDIFWQQATTQYADQLQQLDAKPNALGHLIAEQTDHRLGHYFETLLNYWFTTSSRYEVLAHNLQVQHDKRTIGEFDFILQDHLTNKTQHWEVACKFYLGINDTSQIDNWCGPMLQDKLANKYQKMQTRQSQLSEQAAAQLTLKNLAIHVDEKVCLMKGRLFYPILQAERAAPSVIANNHLQGWWARLSEFATHYKTSPLRWRILNKKQWLAEQVFDGKIQSYTSNEVVDVFLSEYNRPVSIAGFNPTTNNKELDRGFLVPSDWGPTNIAHQLSTT